MLPSRTASYLFAFHFTLAYRMVLTFSCSLLADSRNPDDPVLITRSDSQWNNNCQLRDFQRFHEIFQKKIQSHFSKFSVKLTTYITSSKWITDRFSYLTWQTLIKYTSPKTKYVRQLKVSVYYSITSLILQWENFMNISISNPVSKGSLWQFIIPSDRLTVP